MGEPEQVVYVVLCRGTQIVRLSAQQGWILRIVTNILSHWTSKQCTWHRIVIPHSGNLCGNNIIAICSRKEVCNLMFPVTHILSCTITSIIYQLKFWKRVFQQRWEVADCLSKAVLSSIFSNQSTVLCRVTEVACLNIYHANKILFFRESYYCLCTVSCPSVSLMKVNTLSKTYQVDLPPPPPPPSPLQTCLTCQS